MKSIVLALSLLFCTTVYADDEDPVAPYLGTYSAKLDVGFKEGTASCVEAKEGDKKPFEMSILKKGESIVIREKYQNEAQLHVTGFYLNEEERKLIVTFDNPSRYSNVVAKRNVFLQPFLKAIDPKHRKEAEIVIGLQGFNEHGDLVCWNAFVGLGRFKAAK